MLNKNICHKCFKENSQLWFPEEEWFNGRFKCPPGVLNDYDFWTIVDSKPPDNCPHKKEHE